MFGILFALRDFLFLLSYITNHSSFPKPLVSAEERECLQKMQNGDECARQKLIEHNMRLVAHIARKYSIPGQDFDDLISIGSIGLIKAVSTYKQDIGSQLATYAARCIENEILMVLRASQKRRNDVSLNEAIGSDSEGNEIMLIDVLGTDQDCVVDEVHRRLSLQKVQKLIHQKLPRRERRVLELRYGLLDGRIRPQYEIAQMLGISRSYVSRIEKRAIQILEKGLEEAEINE
ncbi:MAG: RNA polymerase sporulation sigma factor SigK [Oscillospiraceae bacterium]|jgi:RNA polymerase sporulation-specific sigma factor|nr:RNA polymerase sporulation sigma factor SigK [Oscillospiraceae bacterium]